MHILLFLSAVMYTGSKQLRQDRELWQPWCPSHTFLSFCWHTLLHNHAKQQMGRAALLLNVSLKWMYDILNCRFGTILARNACGIHWLTSSTSQYLFANHINLFTFIVTYRWEVTAFTVTKKADSSSIGGRRLQKWRHPGNPGLAFWQAERWVH